MGKNTAAIVVGRLLEFRADAGYRSVSDVDELFDKADAEVARLPPNQRLITIADWRRCPVMASGASDRILQRIMSYNARTERSAAIASSNSPTAVLQFVRLIREAGLPDRKIFFGVDELVTWLSEELSPAETGRLRAFLREGSHARVEEAASALAASPLRRDR